MNSGPSIFEIVKRSHRGLGLSTLLWHSEATSIWLAVSVLGDRERYLPFDNRNYSTLNIVWSHGARALGPGPMALGAGPMAPMPWPHGPGPWLHGPGPWPHGSMADSRRLNSESACKTIHFKTILSIFYFLSESNLKKLHNLCRRRTRTSHIDIGSLLGDVLYHALRANRLLKRDICRKSLNSQLACNIACQNFTIQVIN